MENQHRWSRAKTTVGVRGQPAEGVRLQREGNRGQGVGAGGRASQAEGAAVAQALRVALLRGQEQPDGACAQGEQRYDFL